MHHIHAKPLKTSYLAFDRPINQDPIFLEKDYMFCRKRNSKDIFDLFDIQSLFVSFRLDVLSYHTAKMCNAFKRHGNFTLYLGKEQGFV